MQNVIFWCFIYIHSGYTA